MGNGKAGMTPEAALFFLIVSLFCSCLCPTMSEDIILHPQTPDYPGKLINWPALFVSGDNEVRELSGL